MSEPIELIDWDEEAGAWAYDSRAYRQGIKSLVVDTALWQREALLSDESVERAAKALFYGDIDPDLDVTWATAHEGVRTEYLAMARNALTAAIGEE